MGMACAKASASKVVRAVCAGNKRRDKLHREHTVKLPSVDFDTRYRGSREQGAGRGSTTAPNCAKAKSIHYSVQHHGAEVTVLKGENMLAESNINMTTQSKRNGEL